MLVLPQGKTLTPGDLTLAVRDQGGNLITPFAISYAIFQETEAGIVLVSAPRATPARSTSGAYYIAMTIPSNWTGQYKLAWYLTQYETNPEAQCYEDFQVIFIDPATTSFEAPSMLLTSSPNISKPLAKQIALVRELISDTNPDRNYHFRPPTAGRTVAGFNQRVGFIWTDATIARMLGLATARLNSANPMNFYNYTVDTIPDNWWQASAVGAASFCLGAEAARWTAEEFGYSLNGVSLDLNGKAAGYQGLAETYRTEFNEWAQAVTANRPGSLGLRQSRYLI